MDLKEAMVQSKRKFEAHQKNEANRRIRLAKARARVMQMLTWANAVLVPKLKAVENYSSRYMLSEGQLDDDHMIVGNIYYDKTLVGCVVYLEYDPDRPSPTKFSIAFSRRRFIQFQTEVRDFRSSKEGEKPKAIWLRAINQFISELADWLICLERNRKSVSEPGNRTNTMELKATNPEK